MDFTFHEFLHFHLFKSIRQPRIYNNAPNVDAYDWTGPFTSFAAQVLRTAYRTRFRGVAASWLFDSRRQAHFLLEGH